MRVLVVGGTVFLGRHVVDAALARGDDVTIFHRGRHPTHRPGGVEEVLGDRDRPGDLAPLAGRRFDAVVDTCGYRPGQVAAAAGVVGPGAGHYTFVSSISVYADGVTAPVDESSPVRVPPPDPETDGVTAPVDESSPVRVPPPDPETVPIAEAYGELKVACEQAVAAALPGRAVSVRAGLIVGPFDPTDRFTWWVRRLDEGGEVLAPGVPDQPVQVIDARDLATFVLAAAGSAATGVVNAVGPPGAVTFASLLDAAGAAAGGGATVCWADEAFLLGEGVRPWTEVPLWVPSTDPSAALLSVDDRRARALGLVARPVEATIADVLDWDRARDRSVPLAAGLPTDREAALVAAWHRRDP